MWPLSVSQVKDYWQKSDFALTKNSICPLKRGIWHPCRGCIRKAEVEELIGNRGDYIWIQLELRNLQELLWQWRSGIGTLICVFEKRRRTRNEFIQNQMEDLVWQKRWIMSLVWDRLSSGCLTHGEKSDRCLCRSQSRTTQVVSQRHSLSSMSRCITKQELQLLENWSKTNTSMGIFRSYNVLYIKKQAGPSSSPCLHVEAHHAVRIWNLQLRHLTGFKENIIIWKPCKEKHVCTKKRHHPLPFCKETPIIYIFILLPILC